MVRTRMKRKNKHSKELARTRQEIDVRKVNKEAVENANKRREATLSPVDTRTDIETTKENTIDSVHRRFGTNKEELRQSNVATNKLWQHTPSQTYENSGHIKESKKINSDKTLWSEEVELLENQQREEQGIGDNAEDNLNYVMDQEGKQSGEGKGAAKETGKLYRTDQTDQCQMEDNGTVTHDKTGSMLAYVDGGPSNALMKGPEEEAPMKVRDGTMRLEQLTGQRRMGESNGTVTPMQASTVNLGLGNVYEMQFKLMQAAITTIEQAKENEVSNVQVEQAIVPRKAGDIQEEKQIVDGAALHRNEKSKCERTTSKYVGKILEIGITLPSGIGMVSCSFWECDGKVQKKSGISSSGSSS
ncbi:hypothetical protein A4A49_36352 [Nicotiana attenuata]|uniref:Uncharacterized protein n=1 Tax=Nicotiana attenuata TaxID=49451 RepID=A0A1J6KUK8_NICAT|nr:hypothetical protein A4A49_36352 [Nicotiana attenuata]